jgi:hypothetical protein
MTTGLIDGTYCEGLLPRAKEQLLSECPRLGALVSRICANERIAEWNARRDAS